MDGLGLFAALHAWNHSAAWTVAIGLVAAAISPRAFFATSAVFAFGYLIVAQF